MLLVCSHLRRMCPQILVLMVGRGEDLTAGILVVLVSLAILVVVLEAQWICVGRTPSLSITYICICIFLGDVFLEAEYLDTNWGHFGRQSEHVGATYS